MYLRKLLIYLVMIDSNFELYHERHRLVKSEKGVVLVTKNKAT